MRIETETPWGESFHGYDNKLCYAGYPDCTCKEDIENASGKNKLLAGEGIINKEEMEFMPVGFTTKEKPGDDKLLQILKGGFTDDSNFEFFNSVLEEQLSQTREMLFAKGKEYSKNQDRFSNFKDAASIAKSTPEQALLGMMLKHEVSVRDIVAALPNLPSKKVLDEKIGDWINYLLLLKGLILERSRTKAFDLG